MNLDNQKNDFLEIVPYMKVDDLLNELSKHYYHPQLANLILEKLTETSKQNIIMDLYNKMNEEQKLYTEMLEDDVNNFKNQQEAKLNITNLEIVIEKFRECLNSYFESIDKTETISDNEASKVIIFSNELISDVLDISVDQSIKNKTKNLLEKLNNGDFYGDNSYSNNKRLTKVYKKEDWGLRINYIHLIDNIYVVINFFEKHSQNDRGDTEKVAIRRAKWLDSSGQFTKRAKALIMALKTPELHTEEINQSNENYKLIIDFLSKKAKQI